MSLIKNFILRFFNNKETQEDKVLKENGYIRLNNKDKILEVKSNFFIRIGVEDNFVGIYTKQLSFLQNDKIYTGKLVLGIIRLPFDYTFLDYEYNQRPQYFAELIYFDNENKPTTFIVKPKVINEIIKNVSDMEALKSICIHKATLNKMRQT